MIVHNFKKPVEYISNILEYIYIKKLDIRIYVGYSRPNGWTDWVEIFCEHSAVAGGCFRLKKINSYNFFPFFL